MTDMMRMTTPAAMPARGASRRERNEMSSYGNLETWSQLLNQAYCRLNWSVKNKMRIDLNSDVGESFGPWTMGHDAALMDSISSANIACGFHAGDPGAMRPTIALARENGVAIGAHPGFQDLVGFGRREMKASPAEVEDLVLYQVRRSPAWRRLRACGFSTSRRTARSTTWRAAIARLPMRSPGPWPRSIDR